MAQSTLLLLIFGLYVVFFMAPAQRLVVGPLARVWPSRRGPILGAWLRFQATVVLGLARMVADVRASVTGALEASSCIILMNHQSLLDIPLGVSLTRGPYPLIPTRDRYREGIPGISYLVRMTGFPLVSQGGALMRQELRAMITAADQVARGENSILIYPEGHRSANGEILPFMTAGLRLVFGRNGHRPVYLVVVDGMTGLRSFADIRSRLAGTRCRVSVRGPYTIPPENSQHGKFIENLHGHMVESLREMRSVMDTSPALVAKTDHPD